MKTTIKILLGLILLTPSFVSAHPGNTDAYGCHTCRTNCPKWGLSTGEYHCHQAKSLPQPKEPVKSSATGVTVPAPEYKVPVVKKVTPTAAKETKATTTPVTATKTKSEVKVPQKSFFQRLFSFSL